jgi:DNA mismatch repair ATPase MutS
MESSNHARPPQDEAAVHARYHQLRGLHQQLHDAFASRHASALKASAAVFAVIALQAFLSPHSRITSPLLAVGFVAMVTLIWYSFRQQAKLTREQRLLVLYDRNLRRIESTETQSGRTGLEPSQELRTPGHLYEHDLDLLGPNSLFGLLATVRTGPGERGLARYLLEPAAHEETLLRQQSVQELLPQTTLREKIALLGASRFHQITASFFDEWLADTPPAIHSAYRPALILTALLNVALILAGFLRLATWSTLFPNLALVLCVQAAISLVLRTRVLPLLTSSARLQQNIRLIADGLALMQTTQFDCPKLRNLQRASLEPTGAVKLLKSLEGQLTIVEQRTKEWYFVLSLLLAAGTQAAISIAAWKRHHANAMRSWLAAWSEFEALNAIATYAFEHPVNSGQEATHNAWPELLPVTHPPLYEARALGHPLLANAITNDIALGLDCRFYLISGSNMSGKSTLLRSIGINAVLAYAGAPVCAQSMRLTPLALGASLALTDSLAEGRSKFLAEVERLAAILNTSAASPVLFLVDEIFSGTNSEDRATAARSVLEKLLTHAAIGALSTHDLALTDLATPANHGLNVHMASPDPEDPLAFDYKLKPGINTASSARAILRLIGIDT